MAPKSTSSPTGRLKRLLFGAPIPNSKAHTERLGIVTGLPVFASDNLSSSAYANEAILGILVLYGASIAGLQIWLALAIAVLIGIVAWSYKQTIYAYPGGGGSYIVAKENLGESPGLVAGAALLIDYVLTVGVSVAAGVAAITSAYPSLHPYLVHISIACIAILTFGNLRGVRESGLLFSLPTYGFLIAMALLITFGTAKAFVSPIGHQQILGEPGIIGSEASYPLLFVILRAFAAGCTALTGIEAVSNGIPSFRAPEAKNAARTLIIMAATLTVLFLGIGYIILHLPQIELFATKNPQYSTVISQAAAWTFGGSHTFGFYFVQFSTAAILILAANTAYMDFPRLASLLSRDGYLPRPLARQGDRLVFQNGILVLAIASAILVWAYHGELDQLLPLYAVGVFIAFTLSQIGMIMHWRKATDKSHIWGIVINSIGALLTGTVTIILFVTKFAEGAWIIAIVTGLFFAIFKAIKLRYDSINSQLSTKLRTAIPIERQSVLLLVPRFHRGILGAMDYAMSLHGDCRALHVAINETAIEPLRKDWERYGNGTPLVILPSPYRSLIDPILDYVDQILVERPTDVVTVIVSEAVSRKWMHRLLQENVAAQLKRALGRRQNVVVTSIRYFLE